MNQGQSPVRTPGLPRRTFATVLALQLALNHVPAQAWFDRIRPRRSTFCASVLTAAHRLGDRRVADAGAEPARPGERVLADLTLRGASAIEDFFRVVRATEESIFREAYHFTGPTNSAGADPFTFAKLQFQYVWSPFFATIGAVATGLTVTGLITQPEVRLEWAAAAAILAAIGAVSYPLRFVLGEERGLKRLFKRYDAFRVGQVDAVDFTRRFTVGEPFVEALLKRYHPIWLTDLHEENAREEASGVVKLGLTAADRRRQLITTHVTLAHEDGGAVLRVRVVNRQMSVRRAVESAEHAEVLRQAQGTLQIILDQWSPPDHVGAIRELLADVVQEKELGPEHAVIRHVLEPSGKDVSDDPMFVVHKLELAMYERFRRVDVDEATQVKFVKIATLNPYATWFADHPGAPRMITFLREIATKSPYVSVRRWATAALALVDQVNQGYGDVTHDADHDGLRLYRAHLRRENDEVVRRHIRMILDQTVPEDFDFPRE